ncbi:MAG TPA: SRPBCC family protein [Candidatus Saccharimonadia bacterium]|nr:SRPBCC family protein [Candidatus Saccharimonadia bacterium]
MPYVTTIPVVFPEEPAVVYAALLDLASYPLWNSGMKQISTTQPMREGLQYETETVVAGRVNRATITVVRLVPNEEIELISHGGIIVYRADYKLVATGPRQTRVTCRLKFEFRNFMLELTRSTIESMARARIGADLAALRALLADHQDD